MIQDQENGERIKHLEESNNEILKSIGKIETSLEVLKNQFRDINVPVKISEFDNFMKQTIEEQKENRVLRKRLVWGSVCSTIVGLGVSLVTMIICGVGTLLAILASFIYLIMNTGGIPT